MKRPAPTATATAPDTPADSEGEITKNSIIIEQLQPAHEQSPKRQKTEDEFEKLAAAAAASQEFSSVVQTATDLSLEQLQQQLFKQDTASLTDVPSVVIVKENIEPPSPVPSMPSLMGGVGTGKTSLEQVQRLASLLLQPAPVTDTTAQNDV
jgi:hypothetical protein